ncbi:MAG TPA: response regulator [Fimbriimonadaceae bacterium]|nr:response regulator [Fimbriimonadaceae bacterium]
MAARTVLVVEDSDVESQMLEKGLRSSGSARTVVCVNSTTAAEGYIFAGSDGGQGSVPDLVVLDVKVPPAGGLAFLKMLRSNERTRGVPVLMMSSEMRDQDVGDLYRSGANSFLDKPVDGQEFISLVTAAANYWLTLNLSAGQS